MSFRPKPGWGRTGKRKVDRQWSIRRVRVGRASGPVRLIFEFPTVDGSTAELALPPSELRHPKRLVDKFADFMPVFPANAGVSDAKRVAFIRQLVANDQAPVEIVPAQTGFIDKNTFATHAEILRADGSRTRIKQVEPGLGNPSAFKGSRQGIPRSRHDPKILWVDDAEIVGDRITKVRAIPRNLFTQKTERRIGELGASCVALVVSDVSVHEAP